MKVSSHTLAPPTYFFSYFSPVPRVRDPAAWTAPAQSRRSAPPARAHPRLGTPTPPQDRRQTVGRPTLDRRPGVGHDPVVPVRRPGPWTMTPTSSTSLPKTPSRSDWTGVGSTRTDSPRNGWKSATVPEKGDATSSSRTAQQES